MKTNILKTVLFVLSCSLFLQVKGACTPDAIFPQIQINGGAWVRTGVATLDTGGTVWFGPDWLDGTWSWTGPNGFTASERAPRLTNVQPNQSGDYVVTFINAGGCSSQYTYILTVTGQCAPDAIFPQLQINGGAWLNTGVATLDAGGTVWFAPANLVGTWSWTGPNGFTASERAPQLTNVQSNQSGDYVVTFINAGGCSSQYTYTLTVTAVAPGVPTIGTATAGISEASVAFTAPSSNGGSSIIDYTVTSTPGGFTKTGASSPLVVTGLTNGTAYTFTVTARNSSGSSAASAASNSVTPQCTTPNVTPWIQINNGAWLGTGVATVDAGGSVYFGPAPGWLPGSWSWTGPNGFTASERAPLLTNIQSNQSGDYVVTFINEGGCSSQYTYTLTVISKATPTLSLSTSSVTYNGSSQAVSVNGSVAGSVSNVLYAGSTTVPTNVGSYPITANFTPTDGTNYNSLTGASAGTFTINPATLTLNTGSTTNVSSYTVPQLANSNIVVSTGELVINQTATIQSVTVAPGAKLTHSSGTLTTTNGITLLSDATGTATLMDSYSTPTITATVKQYVTAGRNWYISAPLNNTADYSVLDKGASVAEYNEVTGLWPTVSSGTLTRGKGYVQVASATQGATGTVSFNGTTNSGNVPVTLTNTLAGGKGFNLVGNPYPSYLSWSAVAADNSAANMPTGTMWYRTISYNGKSAWAPSTAYSLNDIVYNGTRFYKVTTAGTSAASGGPSGTTAGITDNSVVWNYEGSIYIFATISASGVASPATVSNIVPPMQAFWVKTTGGTLTFKNAMRTHNTGGTNVLKAPKNATNDIKLIRLNVSNGASADEAVIYANNEASNAFDTYDAPKYFNTAGSNQPEIYTQVGNEKLVINAMNEINQGTEIPLGFATEKGNNFTISVSEFRNFGSDIKVMLKDKQTTTEFDLTTGQSYAFSSSVVNDINRFSVIFRTAGNTTGIETTEKPNTQAFVNTANQITIIAPEKSNYSIYNAVGQLIENGILTNKLHTINCKLNTGVYMVKVNNQSTRVIIK